MNAFEREEYREDVEYISSLPLPWEKLQNGSILISGASGMIGSCLIDALMRRNAERGLNCAVYAVGRNLARAKERFSHCWGNPLFQFLSHNVSEPLRDELPGKIGYVLHLASNTHPVAYATDPIGTITTNVFGTYNLLEFAAANGAERFLLASSNEIYGENRGDAEKFDESYCGYIDCNTLRAGYPESKRCSEALCQAYKRQRGLDVVIARLTRSYGPTMLATDTKAISQFIQKAIAGEDIVLKSAGTQFYSYTYVADAVSGLLTALLCGESGEAYNIADERSDITLRELAERIARVAGTKVTFELPDAVESAGYSRATKARLDGRKLRELGWEAKYDVDMGVGRTVRALKGEEK